MRNRNLFAELEFSPTPALEALRKEFLQGRVQSDIPEFGGLILQEVGRRTARVAGIVLAETFNPGASNCGAN